MKARVMRARWWTVGVVGVMAATLVGVASAIGTLDQNNPGPIDSRLGSCEAEAAQTFAAGRTGLLDTVQLQLSREGSPGDAVVSITETVPSLATPVAASTRIGLPDVVPFGSSVFGGSPPQLLT